jgi:hypothetical protein
VNKLNTKDIESVDLRNKIDAAKRAIFIIEE